MQVVVKELCTSLIFPWADALAANPAIANAASGMVHPRVSASLFQAFGKIEEGGGALNRPGRRQAAGMGRPDHNGESVFSLLFGCRLANLGLPGRDIDHRPSPAN